MEAAGPSQMLVPIYQSTRRHAPEEHNLDTHLYHSLLPYMLLFMFRSPPPPPAQEICP